MMHLLDVPEPLRTWYQWYMTVAVGIAAACGRR